ncbi:MAG: MFS transporter [Ornithinibacter sp.]
MAGIGPGEEFTLRRIALPAFGPSAIWSVGAGAVLPIVALSARGLGASVGLAAVIVGLSMGTEFATAVPAGILVDRIGERRALVLAGLADAAASALAMLAPSLGVLALAVALLGPSGAVFLIARQSYLTAAAPVALRARAMSTLGGVTRIGLFVGPLVGAPLVARWGPQAGFGVAVAGGVLASVLAWRAADLGEGTRSAPVGGRRVQVSGVVARHRRVLVTVGLGIVAIGVARSAKVVVIPLWAEHVGLDAASTSLVFAAAALVEVLLFYPAGSVMDRHGRVWVAVPVSVLIGLGLLLLPLTSTVFGVGALAVLMGVGNGLGSGIVMTLGADAAPRAGRAAFLSVWRLLSLVGQNGAALLVGAVAAVASIGAASVVVGAVVLAGGVWLARWLPEYDPRRSR